MVSFAKTDLMLGKEGAMRAPIMALDEGALEAEAREVVRETVGQVVNGILDAQAGELVSAGRYGRTGAAATRAACSRRPGRSGPVCQAARREARNRGHRALPASRELRRGGHDGGVPPPVPRHDWRSKVVT